MESNSKKTLPQSMATSGRQENLDPNRAFRKERMKVAYGEYLRALGTAYISKYLEHNHDPEEGIFGTGFREYNDLASLTLKQQEECLGIISDYVDQERKKTKRAPINWHEVEMDILRKAPIDWNAIRTQILGQEPTDQNNAGRRILGPVPKMNQGETGMGL